MNRRVAAVAALLVCAGLGAPACADRGPSTPSPQRDSALLPVATPPALAPSSERASTAGTDAEIPVDPLAPGANLRQQDRLSTPGAIRSRYELPGPASQLLRSSTGQGVLVSVDSAVLHVSLGALRGQWAAGQGHELLPLGGVDAVYAPSFREVFALLPRGRRGWSRQWSAGRVAVVDGGVYLVDASTIRKLAADGRDEWYASVSEARQLVGPFPCDDGLLVQGSRGLTSEAVRLSATGDLGRRIALPRSAVLLGASRACDPLIGSEGRLLQLDDRGGVAWGRATAKEPLCTSLPVGVACVAARGEDAALFEIVDANGASLLAAELPIEGRLTAAYVASSPSGGARAIGACTDVTSPCARRDLGRGPFNALVSIDPQGKLTPLFKHAIGHIAFATLPDGRLVTASSISGDATSVVARDASDAVAWQATLPGRLTAGPLVDGDVVVLATCLGFDCTAPHSLFTLTLERPAAQDTAEMEQGHAPN